MINFKGFASIFNIFKDDFESQILFRSSRFIGNQNSFSLLPFNVVQEKEDSKTNAEKWDRGGKT